MARDSPLSIAASVIGILTFAVALLLGVYARVIQLNQAVNRLTRTDDEIREMMERMALSTKEVETLKKNALDSHDIKDEGGIFVILTRVCFLLLKNYISANIILNQQIIIMSSRWEAQRDEFRENMVEIEGLRSKISTIQLLRISK
jgi:hypothetical protein